MTNIEIITKQEELLQFDSFCNDDGWKLGSFMVEYAKKKGISIAIRIVLNNGFTLFQYGPCGTSFMNQNWIGRKINIVKWMDRSSLLSTYVLASKGQDLAFHGLDTENYVLCGGGFPIRIKGCAQMGVIAVSALPHEQDHEFIVSALSEYLGVEIPHLQL